MFRAEDLATNIRNELGPGITGHAFVATFERDHPDTKLESICAELDLPYLSLTTGLRGAVPPDSALVETQGLYIGGGGRWNERGNEIAAATLHALLTAPRDGGPSLVQELLAER